MNNFERLHQLRPDLYKSEEAEAVCSYLRQNGKKIPDEPTLKLEGYLAFLEDPDYVNWGLFSGEESAIQHQVDAHVISADKVPDSYFETQKRMAKERGHGDITIDDGTRSSMVEIIQEDQRSSLSAWAEYLSDKDSPYENWYKLYVWESVIKLGSYNKEQGKFQRRTGTTVSAYPEIARGALAMVYDEIQKVTTDTTQTNRKEGIKFSNLYVDALSDDGQVSKELHKTKDGSWRKFEQSNDPVDALILKDSIAGYGTDWCTAKGDAVSRTQLEAGDFFVYFTKDAEGNDTIPRIAIRMEQGEVAEARGIKGGQHLEDEMVDIAEDKLADLPGGDLYQKKSNDMKLLTAIDNRLSADPSTILSASELRFLYEVDSKIESFGYGEDPRIEAILKFRDTKKDLSRVLLIPEDRISISKAEAVSGGIIYHYGSLNLDGLTSAEGLVLPETINGSLDLGNLTSAEGLNLPETINGLLDLRNLTSAEGLNLPETINGSLYLDSLTSAEGLNLPETINGSLDLGNLTSAEGLNLPKTINGSLYLRNLTSAEGLVLPETVKRYIIPSHLTLADRS